MTSLIAISTDTSSVPPNALSPQVRSQHGKRFRAKDPGAITPLNTLARKHLSHNRFRPADAGDSDMTKLKTLRAVNFLLQAPTARSVSLVGDFNGWDPTKHPMTQGFDKSWSITLELKHGHHCQRHSENR